MLQSPIPALPACATALVQSLRNDLPADLSPGEADSLWKRGEAVAAHLARWGASDALVAAGVLHGFVQHNTLSAHRIGEVCGPHAGALCDEYTHILCKYADSAGRGKPRARQRVLHFVAAYRNPELAFLAVAILWERFLAARSGRSGHPHLYLDEGRSLLSPFLGMLGMHTLKEKVDLWMWRTQESDVARVEAMQERAFAAVVAALAPRFPVDAIRRRYDTVGECCDPIREHSRSAQWKRHLDVTLLADSAEECYRALYWLHSSFQPIDGAFSDTLGEGRIDGTRGLHTSANLDLSGQSVRVNFRVCTPDMEEINAWGLAALHMRRRLHADLPHAWWNDAADGRAQIASAPAGSLPETLYVFSPQGQLFRFHRGCTVVDYAYNVHTDLADQCEAFYVNDELVEPNTPLHHLDLVALQHDAHASGPTQVWLNAARTSRARTGIERFLRRRSRGVDQGQGLLDRRRKEMEDHYGFNVPEHRIAEATVQTMRRLKLARVEDLLADIAAGRIVADQILHPLFADEIVRQVRLPRALGVRPAQVQVSQCCRPRPGDDIIGLPTRRQGEIVRLRLHRADCPRIQGGDQAVPLAWRLQPRLNTLAQVELTGHDEDGLLGDAVRQIYIKLPRVTLHRVEAVARHGVARLRFNLEAENQEVIDEIATALRTLPNRTIAEVRAMRLPPSELETMMHVGNSGGFNPYSRLPVHEQAMFFGRSRELEQCAEWLRAGSGNIWLIGQKRVGKTSLLLYLKRHYLNNQGYVPAFVDFQLLGNLAEGNLFYEIANAVYTDLQTDPRVAALDAPLRALFDHQPPAQFIAYLRSIQSRLGANRLVLLLDEFSRTTDAHLQGQLDPNFFDAWRGVLQAILPRICFITVVQQQTYDALSQRAQHQSGDPSWRLMELGEKLVLKSLDDEDVRRLIEWPMRNFVEFSSESVAYVASLTGGNPFLIQAFCFKLASHMARQDRRRVEWADIDAVRTEFMQPTESVFAHFLDMIRGSAVQVSQQLALLAGQSEDGEVTRQALTAALPDMPADRLAHTLRELTDSDILVLTAPERWRFAARLFQQWLALNPA